jgi:hypothetical protein
MAENKDINNNVDNTEDNSTTDNSKQKIKDFFNSMGLNNVEIDLPPKDMGILSEFIDDIAQRKLNKSNNNSIYGDNIGSVDDINQAYPTTDPDVLSLRNMSHDDQLYFFLDDIVPSATKDSRVIIADDIESENSNIPFIAIPQSIEIFEQIANMPNHAASMYPDMTKYFYDIIWLYNNVYSNKNNPYWSLTPVYNVPMQATQNFIAARMGKIKAFISLDAKKNSIPYRLIYGDNSHKHDFVGVVYLYFQ